ncbi:unnamed protein product [Absidia cylindrospora]
MRQTMGLTDPKPEPHMQPSTSANSSSVEAGYIHDLGLPSLPSLSQLLTTEDKSSGGPPCAQTMTTNTSGVSVPATTTLTSPASSAIQVLQDAQQQQEFFTTATSSSSSSPVHNSLPSTSAPSLSVAPSAVSDMADSMGILAHPPVTTAPLTMLMDPTSAAAAAAAAAIYLPPSQNGLADSTTTAAAAAAAALMVSNPMLPPTTAADVTAGNPSSFYTISPSANSTTATSSPTMTDQHLNNNSNDLMPSFMMPSSNGGMDARDAIEKNYSFVSIPGANQRKRPRRRYDEIERLYHCTWPNCTKSYGTLNHLNAHVSMQKHGAKRHPSEFKEMRRNWRRQKKEREAARKAAEKEGLASSMVNAVNANMAGGHPSMMQSLQSYNSYAPFPSMYTSLPQSMDSISAFY